MMTTDPDARIDAHIRRVCAEMTRDAFMRLSAHRDLHIGLLQEARRMNDIATVSVAVKAEHDIKLPRPKISDAARREVESMAEATEAIGNKEDRVYSEALRFLLREHDRAHADRAWLIAEVERLTEALKEADNHAMAVEAVLWRTRDEEIANAIHVERANVAKLREACVRFLSDFGTTSFQGKCDAFAAFRKFLSETEST